MQTRCVACGGQVQILLLQTTIKRKSDYHARLIFQTAFQKTCNGSKRLLTRYPNQVLINGPAVGGLKRRQRRVALPCMPPASQNPATPASPSAHRSFYASLRHRFITGRTDRMAKEGREKFSRTTDERSVNASRTAGVTYGPGLTCHLHRWPPHYQIWRQRPSHCRCFRQPPIKSCSSKTHQALAKNHK